MKKLLLTILVLCGLNACSKSEETIAGKTFALLPEKSITLSFDAKENRFFGQAVNNYFGEYKLEKNNLTLKLIGSTMMAAPEPEMKKEMDYFQNLGKIKSYSLKNKTLELSGEDIKLQFEETKN
ncbi:MAG: META domain-containing protein [Acetobacter sp.]|nr:META domain-containing protein [Acetobacter sp.]